MGNELQQQSVCAYEIAQIKLNHCLVHQKTIKTQIYTPEVAKYISTHQKFQKQMLEIKTFKIKNQQIYHASMDKNKICNGFGKIIKNDRSVAFGNFENDELKGEIFWILKNGDTYQGSIQHGCITGEGVYTNQAYSYQGYFKNGQFQGPGKLTVQKSKIIFQGQFQKGVYLKGKLQWEQLIQGQIYCNLYEGSFNKNGNFQGLGKLKSSFGQYQGHFKNGLKHGSGKFYFQNGLLFVGNYENGERSGFGAIYNDSYSLQRQKYLERDNLIAFRGNFKSDMPHGKGEIYDVTENKIIEGWFKFGINIPINQPSFGQSIE